MFWGCITESSFCFLYTFGEINLVSVFKHSLKSFRTVPVNGLMNQEGVRSEGGSEWQPDNPILRG